jgi:hypothetical protein
VQRSWWENTEKLTQESTPVSLSLNKSLRMNPGVRGEKTEKSAKYETSNIQISAFRCYFLTYTSANGSRNSSESVVSRLWVDEMQFESQQKQEFHLSS